MRSHFSAAAANEGGNNISTEANSALKSANMEDISTIDNRLDTNSEAIEANLALINTTGETDWVEGGSHIPFHSGKNQVAPQQDRQLTRAECVSGPYDGARGFH